jgi:hypothetical protein
MYFFALSLSLWLQLSHANPVCDDALSASVIHNHEIKAQLQGEMTLEQIQKLTNILIDHGTYTIPVEPHGFVVAANVGQHHGGYGKYIWFRDLARVYQGLAAKIRLLARLNRDTTDAKRDAVAVAKALLRLLADPDFKARLLRNIKNPELHLNPGTDFKEVPLIRRNVKPFIEYRAPTAEELAQDETWGHKQNDALGEFGHAILDAFESEHVTLKDFTHDARRNFRLLPRYLIAVKYWKMWDVGAWEENSALRSSSIAIATSFIERVNHTAPAEAYEVLNDQLGLKANGPVAEAITGYPNAIRAQDSALTHMFWHTPREFRESDIVHVLTTVETLKRPSGYIRYQGDKFLNVAGHEAEWTLFDAQLTYIYADVYLKTGKQEYLDTAKLHARRMLGQVTGVDAVTIEGTALVPWQIPEAYIMTEKGYRVSPNSPLNWATAEFIRATDKLIEALAYNILSRKV